MIGRMSVCDGCPSQPSEASTASWPQRPLLKTLCEFFGHLLFVNKPSIDPLPHSLGFLLYQCSAVALRVLVHCGCAGCVPWRLTLGDSFRGAVKKHQPRLLDNRGTE